MRTGRACTKTVNPTNCGGCVKNPPHGSEGIVKVLSIIGPDEEVYALANDLELEKSMFIRKRVNFCRPGIVAWT